MSAPPPRRLWPNIGAEEGRAERFADRPAVAATRALWTGLFDDPPALACLEEARGLVPWLCDREAILEAQRSGLPVFGASAEIVAHVHDKAFAVALARAEGLEPAELRSCIRVFDPGALADAAAFAREVGDACRSWPDAFVRRGFTLKPRHGTSGRGRVGGAVGDFDVARVQQAASRLSQRGGTILEPWLERASDLSVVMWIASHASAQGRPRVTQIAALEQVVNASGLWLGHRGEMDLRGRIYSGTRWDDDMREAAAVAADAACAAGHLGPCGIDGFSYVRGEPTGDATNREATLRPLIELNARFTLGHVCAGWLRRAHPQMVAHAELAPGRRMAFLFALAAPPDDAEWPERVRATGALCFDLPAPTDTLMPVEIPGPGPFLLFHDDPERLDPLARRIGAPHAGRASRDRS